ncbi:MAG: GHKL domain-containing protein, partial [Planctomycetes bacterium]|nr:GHKL domain-containing protein [Planctomycetota bacterium]
LRAIDNLTQWIEEDLDPHLKGETRRNMDLLKSRVRRMEKMIDGILAYARTDIRDLKLETVDLQELLREVVDLLVPPPTFKIEIDEELPILETVKSPLHQVFSNLINNAIKHHHRPESGVIRISSREEEHFFRFEVADNGPGIDRAFHNDIFMMFKTLRPRDEVEGTGIGLPLVKKIVEQAGGILRIESAPDQGSTFIIQWPKIWKGAEKEPIPVSG